MINPELGNLVLSQRQRHRMGRHAIRRGASADLEPGALPMPPGLLRGLVHLYEMGAPGTVPYSHFRATFIAEIVIAVMLMLAAGLAWWWIDDPATWQIVMVATICLTGTAVAYRALTRNVPTRVDGARVECAHARPLAAGDPEGLGLLAYMLMAAILAADGAFSGLSLSVAAFGAVLTPSQAILAAMLWGAALAFLLGHLAAAAAREYAVAERRRVVRNLMESPVDEERAAGQTMLNETRLALSGSVKPSADRTRARWALAVTVLGLTVAVFLARVLAEANSGPVEPQLPVVWQTAGAGELAGN